MTRDADSTLKSAVRKWQPTQRSLGDELASRIEIYRDLLETAQTILWRANAQTFQFTFVSGYAETLLGYPVEQWINEPAFWAEHIHPEDREWAMALCAQATKEKKTHELEYRMIASDGRTVWVRDIVLVVVEQGRPTELVGAMRDITKRKTAEQALQRSQEHLREVIDTIPVEIWTGPADGTMDFCNRRWLSDLGLTADDAEGDGWQQMLHPDDRDRVLRAWHHSIATGALYEQQERHRMADGQYRWFLCRGTPLRSESGQIVRWFGSNTDINDQKKAEEALRRSEGRWRGIFDNTAVGVALQDSSLRYLTANPAFCRMLGYSLDELQKLSCLEITFPPDREKYQALIDRLLSGKADHFEIEKRYICKSGELMWARLTGSAVENGQSPLWVVMAEDVTDRKQLHDDLRHERDRLRLLLDIGNQLVSKLDIRELFAAVLDGLRRLGWNWAMILLPDGTSKSLVVSLSPEDAYLREGDHLPIEGSLEGTVYRTGKAVTFRIEDLPELCLVYRNDPDLHENVRATGLTAGCALPLIHDRQVIGVLFLMTQKGHEFANKEARFLQEVAGLIATALINSMRFEDISHSRARLLSERQYIEDQVRREGGFDDIIGESSALNAVLRQINAVAATDSTVLITGETGTGKELVARAIHQHSSRRDHSFIKVDCSAIPASLIESELFGHEKGAFTGAVAQRLGRFEAADQGTLFLDEVGDIPLELQTKLLRVLQDHSFERVGGNQPRHVDVRIVAATNRDLRAMVENGEFREDLFYRLRVFPITIPPLRERPADIPPLVQHYVATYSRRMKKDIPTIAGAAMDVFMRYPWPGNVRELQHFIERSVVLTSGRELQAPLSELRQFMVRKPHPRPARVRKLEDVERDSILQSLQESNWVVGGPNGAAVKLGIKRTTLHSRMEKLGISRQRR